MRLLNKILLFTIMTGFAYASPNIETWDADTSGWLITDIEGGTAYGTLDWVSSLGGRSGVLRDTGGASTIAVREDLIYTTSGLAGNVDYSGGGLTITFDFYADLYLPQQLDIYILSNSGGNNYAWFMDVTPVTLGWTSISAPIYFGAGWYNELRRTSSDFSSDLTDIDAIGVRLWYADSQGGQIYGLDNFDVVPEPETWAFLGIAFLSIGYSFREKIDKAMADLMVRVRGC